VARVNQHEYPYVLVSFIEGLYETTFIFNLTPGNAKFELESAKDPTVHHHRGGTKQP
jgi:hypothetical protein